jgi:hypothetical protein
MSSRCWTTPRRRLYLCELTTSWATVSPSRRRNASSAARGIPALEDACQVECGAERRGDLNSFDRRHIAVVEIAGVPVDLPATTRSIATAGARLDLRQDVMIPVREDVDPVQPRRRPVADDLVRREDECERPGAEFDGVLERRGDVDADGDSSYDSFLHHPTQGVP